jgi:hypothetical protein
VRFKINHAAVFVNNLVAFLYKIKKKRKKKSRLKKKKWGGAERKSSFARNIG